MSKLIVLYKRPKDPVHFEAHYREVHIPLAKKLPGLRRCTFGPTKGLDGSEGAFFWMFVGTFDNPQAITAALGSPEGRATVADIPNYHTAAEPPTIMRLDETDG